ncbi:MAG: LexA family transcriptional regulator [Planctomycetes bacterium]|nr:LexA family transcriptional regulator [Planctomycetota bacterium]
MGTQIGLEIKLLRERLKLSAKDLAERIGLSPSQMSRLESGQRRVDAVMLSRIAKALDVHPSHFFQDFQEPGDLPAAGDDGAPLPEPPAEAPAAALGRLIRAERHRQHLTPDELGQRIGKGRAFVADVEAGRTELLSYPVLQKVARALRLDPEVLFEAQHGELRELRKAVARLERAHTERTLGAAQGEGLRGLPLVAGEDGGLPVRFEARAPREKVLDYVHVPGLRVGDGFAVTWQGEEMTAPHGPSFRPGEVLVFSSGREARHRDFVLAALPARSLFRQLFLDAQGRVRLHPLNLDVPPTILDREEVRELFPLVARLSPL